MAQDALQIKERIISFISRNGPSLPVHVARDTGLSILFASAFLSELFNEKRISISNLKVGSSPLYFIPGQEARLEEFSRFLKSREKDAFLLLKEKKVLKESEQHPAIRVALKEIKDFAIPFRKDEETYWRYFLISHEEIINKEFIKEAEKIEKELRITKEEREENEEPAESIGEERIIEEGTEKEVKREEAEKSDKKESYKEEKQKKIQKTAKKSSRQKSKKKDENFFNRIKEFLDAKGIEILDIKDFRDNEAVLKVKKEEEELLFVFNAKKISEKELLKSYKKASESKMKYSLLSFGEPPKKMREIIDAIRSLSSVDKIE